MQFRLPGIHWLAPAALVVTTVGAAGLGASGAGGPRPQPAAAQAPALAVDACIEAQPGDTFEVNILVSGVGQLLAWDVYYSYNRSILEVTGRDVRRILEALPNSNVFDLSDPVPNSTGIYRIGAADTGGNGTAESGGGILATLTLTAKKKGLSWSAVYRGDVNGDGTIDLGPTLTALGGAHIGDSDGNGIFDGTISGGQIAVGRGCAGVAPKPPPPPGAVVQPGVASPSAVPGSDPSSSPSASPDELSESGEASDESPTPTPTDNDSSERRRTPVDAGTPGPPGGDGDSGIPMSSWLVALLGASVGAAAVVSYVIFRTARGTA